MKKTKKILKWTVIITACYFIISTLYFGYDDIDSEKGIYKFYWSGIRGLWEEDRDFGFKINKEVKFKLNGVDGPYLINDTLFYVNRNNQLSKKALKENRNVVVETNSNILPKFTVELKDSIALEKSVYNMPEKLIAISDIEGNFTGFYSFLLANKVIDKNGKWIFGDGHLVINGDFFDRGDQVTQVLWLIYSLEQQAEPQRGKVHFILGNHEIMNLYGDVSYNDFKYIEVAKRISKLDNWQMGLRYIYSESSELGKWLRSKNVIEKIGNNIFVHGGLNIYHVDGKYSIEEMNEIARGYYGIYPDESSVKTKRDRIMINSIDSPFWDRRLNLEWKYKLVFKLNGIHVDATTQEDVNKILDFYKAEKIIIGHSVVDDIKSDYMNSVIKIDVKHGKEINSGKTKGLLIEGNLYYKIDDNFNKERI